MGDLISRVQEASLSGRGLWLRPADARSVGTLIRGRPEPASCQSWESVPMGEAMQHLQLIGRMRGDPTCRLFLDGDWWWIDEDGEWRMTAPPDGWKKEATA